MDSPPDIPVASVSPWIVAPDAVVVTPRTSLPFGDDVVRVRDPWDNLWWLHQHVEDVDFAALLGRMEDPATLAAMQDYDASLDAEMRRRAGS